jgi:chaperone modulatory protein CbpM
MSFALVAVRPAKSRLDLGSFARAARMHPELARRLVVLGLLDADIDASGELWFAPAQLARAARIQRLRAGLPINYAGLGLVLDLLDQLAELRETLREAERNRRPSAKAGGGAPWI